MAEKGKIPGKIRLGDYVTPAGVAVYPHLTKPDTKWKAEGEFRTKLRYDENVAKAVRERLSKFLDQAFEEYKKLVKEHMPKKLKALKRAELPIKPEEDEDGEETGMFLLNVKRTASGKSKKTGEKWKAKIVFADAKGRPVKSKGLRIWSGSELAIYASVFGWYSPKDNAVGVSVEIEGVQIKKLVSGSRDVKFEEMEDADDAFSADDIADTDDDEDDKDADDSDDDAEDSDEDDESADF